MGKKLIKDTTVGRVLFNAVLPDEMPFYNEIIDKKKLTDIVGLCYNKCGNYKTVLCLDSLKDLGFEFAYKSGLSIAIDDIHIPKQKDAILSIADKEVKDIQNKFNKQILTEGERYNKIIDVWTHTTNKIASEMFKELEAELKDIIEAKELEEQFKISLNADGIKIQTMIYN